MRFTSKNPSPVNRREWESTMNGTSVARKRRSSSGSLAAYAALDDSAVQLHAPVEQGALACLLDRAAVVLAHARQERQISEDGIERFWKGHRRSMTNYVTHRTTREPRA